MQGRLYLRAASELLRRRSSRAQLSQVRASVGAAAAADANSCGTLQRGNRPVVGHAVHSDSITRMQTSCCFLQLLYPTTQQGEQAFDPTARKGKPGRSSDRWHTARTTLPRRGELKGGEGRGNVVWRLEEQGEQKLVWVDMMV